MTPQPVTAHLTEEQFGELLATSDGTRNASPAAIHLAACEQCSAEYARLCDSLSLFREATSAYANRSIQPLPVPFRPVVPHASERMWWTAAAALILFTVLPIRHEQRPVSSTTTGAQAGIASDTRESDQALLEDINSVTSASVPTPMQALDNPLASTASDAASTQTSTQRKD